MISALPPIKPWLLLLVAALLVTLSAIGYIYLSQSGKLPSLSSSISSVIINNFNTQSYKVSKNFPPEVASALKASSLDGRDIQVVIDDDITKPIAWYTHQSKKLSGFSYNIDSKVITITIYLNPDLPEKDLVPTLNYNLISGLLYAAASVNDPPHFDSALLRGTQIAKSLIEAQQPLIYIPGIPLSKQ